MAATRTLPVALIQEQNQGDAEANLALIEQRVAEAAKSGARLVLLQELHNGAYFCQHQNVREFELAESIPGPSTERLGKLARAHGVVIVGSLFERRGAGLYHNTAVVFDADGSIAGKYRKMHIPDDPGFNEKFYFTPGDLGFHPVETSVGRLGVLVCWDQWYPEGARLMALAGADLLLYPTAIGWDPDDDQAEKNRQRDAWILSHRGHAVANGLPVLSCNRVGHEPSPVTASGIDFWGSSHIVGPQGEILAEASIGSPELLMTEIDLQRSEQVRRIWPLLRDRRIDAYGDLLKRYRDLRLLLSSSSPSPCAGAPPSPTDGHSLTDFVTQPDAFAGQPIAMVERDGVRYTLLGTAHVSHASVDAVRAAIDSGDYDQVAVELDAQRLQGLLDPDSLAKLDLIKVLREGKTALFAANLALAGYQRRLAEKLGIEPGAELKVAAMEAKARDLPLRLIDRDVGLTFRRAMRRLGWWGRAKISAGLIAGMFAKEDVDEAQIEKLKEGDMLESAFSEFASETPALYETIIAERDRYMAARLRQSTVHANHVLAVVGAGHLKGLARHLREDVDDPARTCEELESVAKKSSIPWFTLILSTLLVAGLAWGFWHGGLKVGTHLLLQWIAITSVSTAIACALAGGHPLSILASAIVAPFKPFRPTIPSGAVGALVEARVRKPTYGDFLALRDDVQTLGGWYRNRVARVLLVFIVTCFGTMVGEWIGILRIVEKIAT